MKRLASLYHCKQSTTFRHHTRATERVVWTTALKQSVVLCFGAYGGSGVDGNKAVVGTGWWEAAMDGDQGSGTAGGGGRARPREVGEEGGAVGVCPTGSPLALPCLFVPPKTRSFTPTSPKNNRSCTWLRCAQCPAHVSAMSRLARCESFRDSCFQCFQGLITTAEHVPTCKEALGTPKRLLMQSLCWGTLCPGHR